jgi:uncharacterized protein (TIGR02001 family)
MDKGLIFQPMWRLLFGLGCIGLGWGMSPSRAHAADAWGGSLGLTNDYLVRGITRSDDQAAVQGDLHYRCQCGLIAGVFASSAREDARRATEAEVSAFIGMAWSAGEEWRGKALASHYAYRGQPHSNVYDYDELNVDAAYRDWLDVNLTYAPNYSRFVPYQGLVRGTDISAELNLQRPVYRKLTATGGVGWSHQGGYEADGYVYWSLGLSLVLAPVAFNLAYVDTSSAAQSLFYDTAARGRWVGTAIWRF